MTHIRPARISDALDLARLINLAGEGMPLVVWAKMTPEGGDIWRTGAERAARGVGGFSYLNAAVAEEDGQVIGGMVAYETGQDKVDADTPPMFRPLIELQNLAPGTLYLNMLAVDTAHRGKGVGHALLDEFATRAGDRGQSIIVASGNHDAHRLYRSYGFRDVDRRAVVATDGWKTNHTHWILMLKN